MPGSPLRAWCRLCEVKLNAHLNDLRRHLKTSKHARNAQGRMETTSPAKSRELTTDG